jgi:hypothetical protein
MAILMPQLTVEVYNADYRVLSRIPWQEAIRLILRGAVYVIDVHTPAVHIRSPSLVIELPVSVALREYVHIPFRPDNRVTREGVLRRDGRTCAYCCGRRHCGPCPAPFPWRRGHLVQPRGCLPVLQRPQGRPNAARSRDEPDPRALRAERTREVPVCAGAGGCLIRAPAPVLNPRSVNR